MYNILMNPDDRKAIEDKPDGVFYKDYIGPVAKVMYVQCDGTGVPGRHQELAGVKGKQPDGSAKTFEVKMSFVVPPATGK